MSSIPGAFPDVQPSSSAPASPMPLGASAELISVRRALQSRRSLFKKDLNQKMALLCGVYVVIVYLYDCSFMLLLLHGLVYWVCHVEVHIDMGLILTNKYIAPRYTVCMGSDTAIQGSDTAVNPSRDRDVKPPLHVVTFLARYSFA